MKYSWLKLDAGAAGGASGGAGGGGQTPPPDWRASLPDDLKAHPALATFKDVPELAKSLVNAQQLIGAKRIALPGPKATEQELNEFYAAIGRPETVDKYSEGAIKPADGLTIDKAGLDKARQQFHKLGLTDAQQKGIMDFYLGGLNESHGAVAKQMEADKAAAETTLRQEWGDKFDANYGMVKNVLRHFGNEEVVAELQTHLGNNVGLTKLLHKIGTAISEDKGASGKFPIETGTPAAAAQRLAELKADKTFQAALNTRTDPGHDDAVALWTEVHRQMG